MMHRLISNTSKLHGTPLGTVPGAPTCSRLNVIGGKPAAPLNTDALSRLQIGAPVAQRADPVAVPRCAALQAALLAALCAAATLVQAAVAPSVSTLAPLAAGVDAPTRVATDGSGNVYVVDSTAGRVVLVDAFNRVLAEKTGLRTPLGIAVDAAGNIYLGEAGAGCVTVFDSQWNPLYPLGAGQGEFQLPSYVA